MRIDYALLPVVEVDTTDGNKRSYIPISEVEAIVTNSLGPDQIQTRKGKVYDCAYGCFVAAIGSFKVDTI